jgi:hypothetical protein
MIAADSAVAERIAAKLPPGVAAFNIAGVDTLEKLTWGGMVDVFVSGYGTGMIFPCYVGNHPGVVHTNTGYPKIVMWGESSAEIRRIDPAHIRDEDGTQPQGVRSHYLDWRPVYEELHSLLEGLPTPA